MYILFNSFEQKKSIINRLESMGFEKSEFSCADNEIIGVGTYYNPWDNERVYVFLNKPMVFVDDERFSWVKNRTKAETEEEFFNGLEKMMNTISKQDELFGRDMAR